jgi:hypothetical protein
MHQGLQAFDDGEVDRARRLLTAAVERGAPHEQALPVLHRIGLLDVASAEAPASPTRTRWRRSDRPTADGGWSRVVPWGLAAAIMAAAAAVVSLPGEVPPSSLAATAIDAAATPLPVPAASEAHLFRARQLFDAGKLPDVIRVLDFIDPGDAAFGEAQLLRARVQRELLAATGPGGREAAPR